MFRRLLRTLFCIPVTRPLGMPLRPRLARMRRCAFAPRVRSALAILPLAAILGPAAPRIAFTARLAW